MAYNNLQSLFTDLIKYNEANIELLGEMQVPITNIYYITMLELADSQIIKFLTYLIDSDSSNPFDSFKSNISFDEEQLSNINLVKSSLQQLNVDITSTLEIAGESSGKIVLVLDVGLLFSLIKTFNESEQEVHLYDFILHKLKKKVDKLFILDTGSILTIGDNHSSVFDELNLYLCKEKETDKKIGESGDITIYKNPCSMYWKMLDLNKKIEYIHEGIDFETKTNNETDATDSPTLVEIDGEETLLITKNISKVCFTNLFELHTCVLDPLDKLKTISIYE